MPHGLLGQSVPLGRFGAITRLPGWMRALLVAFLFAFILSQLSGCSSNTGDTGAAEAVAAGQSAQQTLGTTGGSVQLSSAEGAVFTLDIPPGALTGTTTVRLSSLDANSAQRFQLRLEPAGLVLSNGQSATVTITLPAALALGDRAALGYDGVPLPHTRLPDGRWQVQLSRFADAAPSLAPARAAAASSARLPAQASAAPCGGTPQAGNFSHGSLTAAEVIDVDMYGQCMLDAVLKLAANGAFDAAARAATATAALLQAAGVQGSVGNATAQAFLDQAGQIACTAQRQTLDAATATSASTVGSLHTLVRPILYWETLIQKLGATCANVGVNEYQDVVSAKTDEAMAHYASKKGAIVTPDDVTYTEAAQEARENQLTVQQVQALQPAAAVASTATTQIGERAQGSLLDAMLHAPFKACRDSGDASALIALMPTFGNPDSIKRAAQYCATTLNAVARNASGTTTATLSPALGGSLSGQNIGINTSASLAVQKDGSLSLSGPIAALQCPAGQTGGIESLEIKLNGTLIQTLSSAPYLSSPLQINLAQALQAAGITPESFTSAVLTLTRTGSPCDGFWDANPQPLLTLQLSGGVCVPAAGEAFCVSPVEFAGPPAGVTALPLSFTDTGVLFRDVASSNCQSSAMYSVTRCGWVWKFGGSVQDLPVLFIPTGMADDGSVAGTELTEWPAASGVYQRGHVSVLPAGQSSLLRLASSPDRSTLQSGLLHYVDNPVMSLNGRLSYREYEQGVVYPPDDLGYCLLVTQPNGTIQNVCVRERWHRASGPNWQPSLLHEESYAAQPYRSFGMVGDVEPFGLYGRFSDFTGNAYAAVGFALVAGAPANSRIFQADALGNQIMSTFQPSATYLLPANPAAMPDSPLAVKLGPQGHLLSVSASGEQRYYDLGANRLIAQGFGNTVTVAGQTATYFTGYGYVAIDAKGRMVAAASSDQLPLLRAVILTPPGVALP